MKYEKTQALRAIMKDTDLESLLLAMHDILIEQASESCDKDQSILDRKNAHVVFGASQEIQS